MIFDALVKLNTSKSNTAPQSSTTAVYIIGAYTQNNNNKPPPTFPTIIVESCIFVQMQFWGFSFQRRF